MTEEPRESRPIDVALWSPLADARCEEHRPQQVQYWLVCTYCGGSFRGADCWCRAGWGQAQLQIMIGMRQ